jgi:hypothetical protein
VSFSESESLCVVLFLRYCDRRRLPGPSDSESSGCAPFFLLCGSVDACAPASEGLGIWLTEGRFEDGMLMFGPGGVVLVWSVGVDTRVWKLA